MPSVNGATVWSAIVWFGPGLVQSGMVAVWRTVEGILWYCEVLVPIKENTVGQSTHGGSDPKTNVCIRHNGLL